ncbi:MAG: hypothetical protein AAFO73_12550, partial [Pseudomonadota bacterium]
SSCVDSSSLADPDGEEVQPGQSNGTVDDGRTTSSAPTPRQASQGPAATADSPIITNVPAFLSDERPPPAPTRNPVTPVLEPASTPPFEIARPVIEQRSYDFKQIDRKAFSSQLDRANRDIVEYQPVFEASVAKVAFAFGSALSVGSVSWLLRGGALAAALMSSLPAWRRFDPIAVVTNREDEWDDREPSEIEKMLAHVKDAGQRAEESGVIGKAGSGGTEAAGARKA